MRRIILFLILTAIVAVPLFADTTFVSGSVSGVWDTSGSPYVITGIVIVDSAETLWITPGVEITGGGNIRSEYGSMVAIGTDTDTVRLSDLSINWDGFALGIVKCSYCQFDNIEISAPLELDHCLMNNGIEMSFYCVVMDTIYSPSKVLSCIFNSDTLYIGGEVVLENCLILAETGGIGGWPMSSSCPFLVNCTVVGNFSYIGGGYSGMMSYAYVFTFNSIIVGGDSTYSDYAYYYHCILNNVEEGSEFSLTDCFYGDPCFIDSAVGNYLLKDSSIAIGAGDTEEYVWAPFVTSCMLYAPTVDLDGNPRPNPPGSTPDLGCYENPRAHPAAIAETEKPAQFAIRAYPNPFNSAVVISVGAGLRPAQGTGGSETHPYIEIFDINGRMVANIPVGAGLRPARGKGGSETAPLRNETTIWTPDESLPSGIYLVRASVGDGQMATKRVVYLK